METELTFLGYSIKKDSLPAHFLENIRTELYVKPTENPNFPTNESAYPVFRLSKNKLYLPRYYGIMNYGQPKVSILQEGTDIDVPFQGSLRPIQQTTIEETIKNYDLYGGGLVSLDTGLGKTVVALKLVSMMKKKTLIIVHAEFLLEQWISRIKTFLPTARIGIIRQDKCQYQDCDIIVGMLQSIIKRDYPVECFKSLGSLIIDECFPYRQLISTENGPIEIGSIYKMWKEGKNIPLVLSFNEESGETEYKKVTYGWERTNENLLKIKYSNVNEYGEIECTENHKIYTPNGYIAAKDLKNGSIVYGKNCILLKIVLMEKVKNESMFVYDIEVEDNHNFICSNGPIVHNCHHIGSKTFSSIFFKVQTKYMLGLSATPERKDGLSKVIYWFLGPQIVDIKRDLNKPKINFVISDPEGLTEKFNKLGKVNNPTMITDLTLHESRNKLIVDTIKKYLLENRKILVLSDRRAHCEYIHSQLEKEKLSSGVYLGGMNTDSRAISVDCSVIVGTYQASGEGFDVPELDTLIMATPKSDVQQAVGRILRQKNKNDPIVIDIVDPFSIFKGQYQKRKKYYKSCNYQLIN
jgi:superfamily II DNA or RNA helicase